MVAKREGRGWGGRASGTGSAEAFLSLPSVFSVSGARIQPPLSRGPPLLESRGAVVAPLPVRASQVVLVVKSLPANVGDTQDAGLIPGLGSSPGEGHGSPLQYSCLENPIDRGA